MENLWVTVYRSVGYFPSFWELYFVHAKWLVYAAWSPIVWNIFKHYSAYGLTCLENMQLITTTPFAFPNKKAYISTANKP